MDWIILVYLILFFFGIYFLFLFIILYKRNQSRLYEYPKPKKFLPITIIVPVYNEGKAIESTLKSVAELDYPIGKKHIVVVDDCSTDNSYRIINEFAKKYSNMIVVQTPKNTGNAAGSKNYGLRFAKTPLVGFVDSDSMPNKDSLIKMVGNFEEDEKFAAITSRVWVKKNKMNFIERFQDFDYVVIAWGRKILDFIGCVYVTNGPLSIYRKSVVDEIGGYDEKNMTEDIEITWNILSKGYKTGMSYSTKVYTNVPYTFNHWVKQRVRWNVGGIQTLYKYRKFFFKHTENLFGYFIVAYVFMSFLFALAGFFLFLRYLYFKTVPYVLSIPYYLKGYNPFRFLEFHLPVTLLFVFGVIFLTLSIIYYKYASRESDLQRKNIRTILTYAFVYRPLYTIPLLISLYKLAKRDIGWYTK